MITSELLTKALVASGIREEVIAIFDEDYELPAPETITGPLANLLGDILFQLEIRFVESQFDCNKFAKLASTLADLSWLKTRAEESALAFGLFGMRGHMLNVAVHLRGDHADASREITVEDLRVAFYEPQPTVPEGRQVFREVPLREATLTREEIANCVLCEFI